MNRAEESGETIQGQAHQHASTPQPSQVDQLRAQIEAELTSMQQGLSGLASGTARHSIISAKLRRVDHLTVHLSRCVGKEAATEINCQAYMRVFAAQEETPHDE
ncbi:hypothetical protein EPA93_07785 [Ktedonosporobacter rubrisoli]|uniref:Uncharacterized protein n=1 Tax=Ktedonosporobacter rubrisoli TaxID=2509675 RepID=A0A4P6JL58_KTERU|nr:hypothetical protein [Ktedonosporobacter rubrisoli]QBD75915.1 hypothetical protein EPA93_07785 [Ktedonosporobacter rubrisoli]